MFEFHNSSVPDPLWKEDQINYDEVVAVTTAGDDVTYGQTCVLAAAIYHRFGKSPQAATEAWNRMMQTTAETGDFLKLVEDNTTRIKHQNIATMMQMANGA